MIKILPVKSIKKTIKIPSDKSISHRAVMLSALSNGKTVIKPFLRSLDTLATLDCIQRIGVKAKLANDTLTIYGKGMFFKYKKKLFLNAKESGTTIRILSGLLVAQNLNVKFLTRPSLSKRPMGRIVIPLQKMKARIRGIIGKNNKIYPPLYIEPSAGLEGVDLILPIASAQVKSALILASLFAKKQSTITEPYKSRDHTERMLKLFRARISVKGRTVITQPTKVLLSPKALFIPSDFSSAAFFIVLGLISRGSRLILKKVNINPTRAQLLKVLKRMGGKFKILNKVNAYEPYADILIESSQLKAAEITPSEIPSMIDEIPVLCVAAAYAKGETVIRGVEELTVKETNRVNSMIFNLKKAGVKISTSLKYYQKKKYLTLYIKGAGNFSKCHFKCFNDHRTAMSMVIFSLASGQENYIDDLKCIDKSFPDFLKIIKSLYLKR